MRDGAFGWLLLSMGWLTVAVAPVLLLLLMQIQFLPYHSSFITWTQRIALFADLALMWLLWWLWRTKLSGAETDGQPHPTARAWLVAGGALSVSAFLFSWTVATFPGEWQEGALPGLRLFPATDPAEFVSFHNWLFNSPVDFETRRRWLPFSSTLVLTALNVYEGLGIDDPEKAKSRDYLFLARSRDLKGAILTSPTCRRSTSRAHNFRAQNWMTRSFKARRSPTRTFKARRSIARGFRERRSMALSFRVRSSIARSFRERRSTMHSFRMRHSMTRSFRGRTLVTHGSRARRSGRRSSRVRILVTRGFRARRSMARSFRARSSIARGFRARRSTMRSFRARRSEDALLRGSWLTGAQLQGASLDGAELQGASLVGAELQGTSLIGAQLQAAKFDVADLRGASLQAAYLRATEFSSTFLWRTNREVPREIRDIRLPEAFDAWQPLWKHGNGVIRQTTKNIKTCAR